MKKGLLKSFTVVFFLIMFSSFERDAVQKRIPFCGFKIERGKGVYYNNSKREYITTQAVLGDKSGIPEVVDEIEKVLNFDVQIEIYLAKAENNCMATIGKGGKRMLITDVDFLEQVNDVANTKWAAISVIAHEVGHHVAGMGRHPSPLDDELDADYWSGYVLYKLGASQNASIQAISKFGTETDTDSHPNKYSRIKMIKLGWNDAHNGEINYSKCEECKP